MTFYLLLAGLAIAVFAAPFVPGWLELYRRRDSQPLHINMEHSSSPFFFGDSFGALLRRGLFPDGVDGNPAGLEQKEYTIKVSRPEKVGVITAPAWSFAPFSRVRNIVYAAGDLEVGEQSSFAKELVAEGRVRIGGRTRLRAALCRKGLELEEGTSVARWLDVRDGGLTAGANCRLGRSASSAGPLNLGPGCAFSKLYGLPIRTFAAPPPASPPAEGNIREKTLVATALLFSIPAGAVLRNNVLSTQALKICAGAEVHGDIKGLRGVELEEGVTVQGTIVADGAVVLGANCRVNGNIFAQGGVRLGHGCVVGEEGHVKSVIGRSTVSLEAGTIVHGHIACEKGTVAKA